MSKTATTGLLPSTLEKKLRSIRRRHALLTILRALAVSGAVLIVAMVVAMAVDWSFTLFSSPLRAALTVGSISLSAVALIVCGIRPLAEALRLTRAANNADAEVPQLEERWTTVATISRTNNHPVSPTAQAMLQQVTSEAIAMERLVRPARVAQPTPLRPAAILLATSTAILAGFLALNWSHTSVLLQRFWSPLSDITATRLNCITGDTHVPRGDSLDLVTELSGVHRESITLEMQTGEEPAEVVQLTSNGERRSRFIHRTIVDSTFRYRLRAGDGRTAWHTVTAVDYPELAEVRMTVTPPKYVNRPAFEKTLIPGRLKAVQGSRLELWMRPAGKLERVELAITRANDEQTKVDARRHELVPDDDGWYRFETQLMNDMTLSPTLVNTHGLTNEDRRVCRIQVMADKAPVARVISPTDEMAVAVDDVIDIKFEAHDDHGVATAELVVYEESSEDQDPRILSIQEIPLGDQRFDKHVMAQARLDLKQLELEKDTNISYAIRVTDNRMVQRDTETDGDSPATTESSQSSAANPDAMPTDPTERTPDSSNDDAPDNEPTTDDDSPSDTVDATDIRQTDSANDADEESKPNERPNGRPGERPNRQPGEASEKDGQRTDGSEPGSDSPAETDNATPETRGELSVESQPEGSDPTAEEASSSTADASVDEDNARSSAVASTDTPSQDAEDNADQTEQPNGNVANNDDASSNGESSSGKPSYPDAPQSSEESPPRDFLLAQQWSESGQNSETGRRRLKITERLEAVAAAANVRDTETSEVRERVEEIDRMLEKVEGALTKVVARDIPDADRAEQFRRVDKQIGEITAYIAGLREDTRDHEFAFVGLQMVHIGRAHITPAQDRVFIAIREPLGTSHPTEALHHIVRAREMLAALLKRYDRVARDAELAESLEEIAKIYEIYVEKSHRLMTAARQNRNPLQRKMAVVEVDQAYLDRYAEVETLRREMWAEIGRMLGDDPRMLARYLDIVRRRRSSLRDQLSELAAEQVRISEELSGWLQISEDERDTYWSYQVTQTRLDAAGPLAKEAAGLAERVREMLPLSLQPDHATPALVIRLAEQISGMARSILLNVEAITDGDALDVPRALAPNAERLCQLFGDLDAALEQLNFDNAGEEDVADFATVRLLESRTVADLADEWAQFAGHLDAKRYHGLAQVDQHKLATATELLRIAMLDFDDDIEQQFQQQVEASVPGEIVDGIRELHRLMEAITFNQASATFAMTGNRLPAAAKQQAKAMERFAQAEQLFDQIREGVITALDEYDPRDPSIDELEDPTLDEFFEQLEREPNIEAQLGIPARPRNIRVLRQMMTMRRNGGDMLGDSEAAARARARIAMAMEKAGQGRKPPEEPPEEMTDEERRQREMEQQTQESLEEALAKMEEKIGDPETSPEMRKKLEQQLKALRRIRDGATGTNERNAEAWDRLTESDEARTALRMLAAGKGMPDNQWNKLLSTLDDGLWQVRGRSLPEDRRKAIEQYLERIRQSTSTNGPGAN